MTDCTHSSLLYTINNHRVLNSKCLLMLLCIPLLICTHYVWTFSIALEQFLPSVLNTTHNLRVSAWTDPLLFILLNDFERCVRLSRLIAIFESRVRSEQFHVSVRLVQITIMFFSISAITCALVTTVYSYHRCTYQPMAEMRIHLTEFLVVNTEQFW